MPAKARGSLTYANVMATIAVFVALGGSSYAAIKVTGKNVKDSSLMGKDIKNSSLGTADVKNGSLLAGDFKSGQLPAGPRGVTGPAGPPGPPGSPGAPGTALGLRKCKATAPSTRRPRAASSESAEGSWFSLASRYRGRGSLALT